MKIAVVGATGMVGNIMLKVLKERNFPISELLLVASEKSVGKKISFKGKDHFVIGLQEAVDQKPDIAVFSAGGETSTIWSPKFASAGTTVIDNSSAWRMDPDVPPIRGMIQSWYDAPGGFSEEMREFSFAGGVEYWYNNIFSIRGGFFYEDKTKGNRKFFTLGAGLKYNVFGLDFAYLIPLEQHNPLENTLRFSLLFDFDAFKGQN